MLIFKARYINLIHIFAIVLVGVILTIPAIFYGVLNSHDALIHLSYSKYFSEQFWMGDLYPRWLLRMNAGLGSPTFFFYAPVPYYFTSLFHPLFTNDTSGWNQLSLSASIALVASGITAYLWLRKITNQNSALIASIVYMVWPYHLAVDLYRRFAFAEYWSFVWMPLILYFSIKIISGSKINLVGLSVSYALLAMTHLPTFVIFFPVPIGYILLIASKRQRKKALTRMVVAIILTVGLSAIYWFPAMTTREYISMNYILTGHYFYGNNFFFSSHSHSFWQYLEIMTLLMGGLAGCAFMVARNHPIATSRRESTYWIFMAMISIFMTLPLSKSVWDVLPIVQRIQYPWRFNTVLTVANTALLALSISALKRPIKFFNSRGLSIVIFLTTSLLISVILYIPVQEKFQFFGSDNTVITVTITALLVWAISSLKKPINFSNQKFLVIGILLTTILLLNSGILMLTRVHTLSDSDSYFKETLEISRSSREHRPRWVPEETFNWDSISHLGKNSPRVKISTGEGNLSIQQWKPRKIVLQVKAITDVWLTINQYYYPGWTARLKEQSQALLVQPSKSEGLLQISVPAGKHEVLVTLNAGLEERVGQIISAISAIIALFLVLSPKALRDSVRDLGKHQTP